MSEQGAEGQNLDRARSVLLFKNWSGRSVSLQFRFDTAHTTSLRHVPIHPEITPLV